MVRNVRTLLFGTKTAGRTGDAGLLLLRVAAGLALALLHGIGKIPPGQGFVGHVGGLGFPVSATAWAWAAAFAEFGGGLLLAIGLLTRPVAALVALHFVFVVFVAHAGDAISDRELPLFFLFTALLFTLVGAGRYAVDALITRRIATATQHAGDERPPDAHGGSRAPQARAAPPRWRHGGGKLDGAARERVERDGHS
jgi:putative oxidoreductase